MNDIQPRWGIVKLEEIVYWDEAIKENLEHAYGVFVFDRNLSVHCCSATGNYELHRIGTELHPKRDSLSEMERERYADLEIEADASSNLVEYHGIYSLDKYLAKNPDCYQEASPDPDEDPVDDLREGWCAGALLF